MTYLPKDETVGLSGEMMNLPEVRSLWRVSTLAYDCDVSERTIWRAIKAGDLETVRIGRATLVTDASRRLWLARLAEPIRRAP